MHGRVDVVAAVVTLLLAGSHPASGDVLYDLSADWSLASNPNGPWSYNRVTGSPLPFVQLERGGITGETFWATTASGTLPPAWGKAVTIRAGNRWERGDVLGHSTTPDGSGSKAEGRSGRRRGQARAGHHGAA